jgi:hypothetical protein
VSVASSTPTMRNPSPYKAAQATVPLPTGFPREGVRADGVHAALSSQGVALIRRAMSGVTCCGEVMILSPLTSQSNVSE